MLEFELSKSYEPKAVEERWYPFWLERRFFHGDERAEGKKPFSLVIPPPNVTGALHMGHGLDNTLQDILVRTKRMQGYNVSWIPGVDHAGIATQNVVERALAKEGIDRHQLGREEFIKRVWAWKEKYGDQIIHQLKRLGASCDWDRQRFTMDEGFSRAVREAFVFLYQEGNLYRGKYLVNWCPRCHTALSDLEVEHEEVDGHLWQIKYPVASKNPKASSVVRIPFSEPSLPDSLGLTDDGRRTTDDAFVVVATTRPETMLGDTAVAVHPEDERYGALIGQTIRLPLSDREIPIIADHRVDREFGTGAVKVTPAHDPNDFRMGQEHELPQINILTPEGKINENGGRFAGLDRFEARTQVIAALEADGLLVHTDDHRHAVGHCYRCKTIVEPYLSRQWFVRTKDLSERAVHAVKTHQCQFFPKQWERTYFDWMERMHDWCVSRQLWWGHRIPAWYCSNARDDETRDEKREAKDDNTGDRRPATDDRCGPIVAREQPARCPHCGDTELVQDPDVLDTWFSSALWPFGTLGWPDQTTALKTFYPTTVLVTGFDIIFFWVVRMMMMGLRFMGEVPFKHVFIHALIRDPQGQKMSKSKGNVVDPLELMDRYGTDAFRFTLAALSAQGRDIRIDEDRFEGYRHFSNKLWNAARFIFMQVGEEKLLAALRERQGEEPDAKFLSMSDKWIMHNYQKVVRKVTESIEAYEFDQAAGAIYQFLWGDFCDWYVEASKTRLQGDDLEARWATAHTMLEVFDGTLRLLHPFMPFITEELWQKLQVVRRPSSVVRDQDRKDGIRNTDSGRRSIVVAAWPAVVKRAVHVREAKNFQLLADVVSSIRTIRSEHQIPPVKRIAVILVTDDDRIQKLLGTHGKYLRDMAKLDRIEVRLSSKGLGPVAAAVAGGIQQPRPKGRGMTKKKLLDSPQAAGHQTPASTASVRGAQAGKLVPDGTRQTAREFDSARSASELAPSGFAGGGGRREPPTVRLTQASTASVRGEAPSGFAGGGGRREPPMIEVYVPLSGLIDMSAERGRLEKEIAKVSKTVEAVSAKLANAEFMQRAPEPIVEAERSRMAQAEHELQKLQAALTSIDYPAPMGGV